VQLEGINRELSLAGWRFHTWAFSIHVKTAINLERAEQIIVFIKVETTRGGDCGERYSTVAALDGFNHERDCVP
jgi:hypothetical protein